MRLRRRGPEVYTQLSARPVYGGRVQVCGEGQNEESYLRIKG